MEEKNAKKWKLIVCFCRGAYKAQKDFNLWEYVNAVTDLPEIEFVVVVPMVCKTEIAVKRNDDGKMFLKHFIREGETYLLGACDRDTQRKKLKDTCEELGIDFEKTFHTIDLRFINAQKGVERTLKKLEELGSVGQAQSE